MNEELKEILQQIYANHNLQESDLDYTIADKYIADLNKLSLLNNCCFFIVDLHKFEYIFTSDNFKNIFGYLPVKDQKNNQDDDRLLDSRIHPGDFLEFKKMQLKVGEFILQLPKEERPNYKHVFELRVLNMQQQYVRISWERQALETDKFGNLWLMLGIINILPDQSENFYFKSFFINLKTGERVEFNPSKELPFELTSREKEVLELIRQGFLSKEIATQLSISVNTVNIHRQNILHKMGVSNSLEAVNCARALGILE